MSSSPSANDSLSSATLANVATITVTVPTAVIPPSTTLSPTTSPSLPAKNIDTQLASSLVGGGRNNSGKQTISNCQTYGHGGVGGLLETDAGHGAYCSEDGDVALEATAEGGDGGDEVGARGDLNEGRAEGGGDFAGGDDGGLGLFLESEGQPPLRDQSLKLVAHLHQML